MFDFISNNADACSFPSNPPEPVIKQYLFVRLNFDLSIVYNYYLLLLSYFLFVGGCGGGGGYSIGFRVSQVSLGKMPTGRVEGWEAWP